MLTNHRLRLGALALISALALFLAGCKKSAPANPNGANASDTAELFTIPADQMAHVQVLSVQPATITRTLRLTGAVTYNGFHTTPVITQVSGPVNRIAVVPGQSVTRGEPMLYVASPDYSQLRSNYLKARDAYSLAQKSYARAKDLYEHHALAEQNLEQAESVEVQAQGDLTAAEAALKVLGITDPNALLKAPPSFEATVKAPINGQVVEQDVAVGQFLQPGATQCFVISDTSNVWVLVNVYQKDLPFVRVGDHGHDSDRLLSRHVSRTDLVSWRRRWIRHSRTLQARIETGNPGQKLKKDMYVVATVDAGTIQNAIAVPDAAVLARYREPAVCLRATWTAISLAERP